MFAFGIVLTLCAWLCLSLGLPRHAGTSPSPSPPLRARRISGWLLLAAGPAWFVAGWGWEFGLVYWAAVLMLCAIACVLLLARWPRHAPRAAFVLCCAVLVLVWLAPTP
jgi:hypothetical protein